MAAKFLNGIMKILFYSTIIATFLFGACKEIGDVYTPNEWLAMFKKAGGWIPLPFPDSKYRPGSIIKVTENEGIRWIDHLESCRYPEEVLKPEKGHIPGITFEKGTSFDANAMINVKGISAGSAFDRVSKVSLNIQDHGTDSFRLIYLKVWSEDPAHRRGVSSACMDELKKPDYYLITEAFRVSKGTYTLYDKTGAAIKLTAPKLGDLLQFQPDVKYEVTSDGKLVIDQPVYFAIRKAVKVGNDFEVLGEDAKKPQTADAMIEKLFLKTEGNK